MRMTLDLKPAALRAVKAVGKTNCQYTSISARANRLAFQGDPDWPLLLALERYDEDTGHAEKAAIFRERTIEAPMSIPPATSAHDTLLVTLNQRGAVDLDYLAQLLHRLPEKFLPELAGSIFQNPETRAWETDDSHRSVRSIEYTLCAKE